MTLFDDVKALQKETNALREACETTHKDIGVLAEQINGQRGLNAVLDAQTQEIRSLRRAAYWVVGLIVAGAIGFAFSVLILIPGPHG